MRIKYPGTPHLSWSEGVSKDDIILTEDIFSGREVVITEKLDGESCTMYSDYIHARSINSSNHPSRDYVKGLWGEIKKDIPEGFRICGENLFAKHSIHYTNLSSYFLVFSIWDKEICLSWEETKVWCSLLSLRTVPVLYTGIFPSARPSINPLTQEGYVVRFSGRFSLQDFSKNVGKYVRKNHVQTDEHWLNRPIEKNLLADDVNFCG